MKISLIFPGFSIVGGEEVSLVKYLVVSWRIYNYVVKNIFEIGLPDFDSVVA
jgi:hypothetical protein